MSTITKRQQILGLLGWLGLCFAASSVGAIASIQALAWRTAHHLVQEWDEITS